MLPAASLLALLALSLQDTAGTPDPWVVYEGGDGPGAGKHIVLIAGDEEYRSEEALPMLGKILAVRHGFKCTVLFSTDPETGAIDPKNQTHIKGLAALADADLAVVFLRFRELPDEDMRHFVDFVERGGPIIGIRTSTHAFDYKRNKDSKYARYHWRHGDEWKNGFGGQILGETWVSHHGRHGSQSTRGVVEPGSGDHPILRGLADVWGPTDVYGINDLPADAQILLRGAVLDGMSPESKPVEGKQNEPMIPLVWTRSIARTAGAQRVVCSTIGASQDMSSEGLRRVLVNSAYWCVGLEEKIPDESDVRIVGEYDPTPFGFNKAKAGVYPRDHALKD